jgi:hypothetical protein
MILHRLLSPLVQFKTLGAQAKFELVYLLMCLIHFIEDRPYWKAGLRSLPNPIRYFRSGSGWPFQNAYAFEGCTAWLKISRESLYEYQGQVPPIIALGVELAICRRLLSKKCRTKRQFEDSRDPKLE